jgi:uncharacterized membrane protein
MTYCANCGSPVEGAFCPNCGRPVGQAQGGGYPPSGYPAQPAQGGLTENVAGALCYLGWLITGIIFLVVAPYNASRTVRFHAFQSIFFSIAVIGLSIVGMIITAALAGIPFLGWLLSWLLWSALWLGILILWLLLMWKAYSGDRLVLPVIGPLAEKQAQG